MGTLKRNTKKEGLPTALQPTSAIHVRGQKKGGGGGVLWGSEQAYLQVTLFHFQPGMAGWLRPFG
jgi:hypothetical protein